jgi:hypothetical protein
MLRNALATCGAPDRLNAIKTKEEDLRKWIALADAQNTQQFSVLTANALRDVDLRVRRLMDKATAEDIVVEEQKLDEVVKWISTAPFTKHHAEVKRERMTGSDCWLLRDADFENWLSESSSSVFLLQGIAGCGKSVVFSAVIDHFTVQPLSSHALAPCAFFYCGGSSFEPERRSSTSILRSLVRQLAVTTHTTSIFQAVLDAYEMELVAAKKWRTELMQLSGDKCVSLIVEMLAANPAYIAIDALDELEAAERATLIQALQSLVTQATNVVKIFLTSRHDAHVEALLPSVTGVKISSVHNASEVTAFVENQLRRALQHKLLLNGSPSTKTLSRVSKVLVDGAGEMYAVFESHRDTYILWLIASI